jgi:GH25 family lysozyme M1 (1,4-beta-N-acetylmuramidase)
MLDRAEELAKALIETSSTDSQRIQLAFERILFRPPTAEEERWVSELLLVNAADTNAVADITVAAEATATADATATEQASERLRRWTDICHALLNTNSFLYIE